jgi:deoxycytidylate deaminase
MGIYYLTNNNLKVNIIIINISLNRIVIARSEGATAYITHYPCIICTRLLLASGVKHIKYLEDYKNDDLVKIFTNELSVKIEQLI